jgi:uncharacterized membrane protein YphA (DoxX/SURF4 family)
MQFGRHVYGLAALLFGIVGLTFQDFGSVWQPISTDIPGYTALACITAFAFTVAGLGLQIRATARLGAAIAGLLYLVFAIRWGWRAVNLPQVFAIWLGVAEQMAMVIGAFVLLATLRPRPSERAVHAARLAFGICLLVFGAAHIVYVSETAAMTPAWLPPNTRFWAIATGGFHILAGLAFLSGIRTPLAARLVTAMFVTFGALVWAPQLAAGTPSHMVWCGNAQNLALVGAAWVLADAIGRVGAGRKAA